MGAFILHTDDARVVVQGIMVGAAGLWITNVFKSHMKKEEELAAARDLALDDKIDAAMARVEKRLRKRQKAAQAMILAELARVSDGRP